MKFNIPFYKIKQGSRIVLYGYGKNGRYCCRRLIKTGYCDLVGIVDKNYNDKQIDHLEVQPTKSIKNMEFDYCLITILDQRVASSIRNDLINLGIDNTKIIDISNTSEQLDIKKDPENTYVIEYLYKWFEIRGKIARQPWEYYPELEKTFINERKKLYVLDYMKIALNNMSHCKPKMIALMLMYECKCFDSECMKMLFECMKNIEWDDDTYYGLVMQSTIMIFHEPQYIYRQFFKDRILLQKKICDYYNLRDVSPREKNRENKITIVTRYYMPNNVLHPQSKLCKDYALAFAEIGIKVQICIICPEVYSQDERLFLCEDSLEVNDCVNLDKETVSNSNINCEIFSDENISERLNKMVRSISDFQPKFILDMGDECFPEAYALIDHFPIITMAMRGNNFSSCTSVEILPNKDILMKDMKSYDGVSDINIKIVSLGNLGRDKKNLPIYLRDNYGFTEDDFIVVTVGTRLSSEVDYDLVSCMVKLLSKKVNMKWLLVGDGVYRNDSYFIELQKQGRIINWGIEPNLESLYRMCNVYLNPKRRGGGVSIRLAMAEGLPVAMLSDNSDATSRMRADHIVYGGYEELIDYVKRLSDDNTFYDRIRKETLEQIKQFSFKNDVKKVLEICYEEVLKYNERN